MITTLAAATDVGNPLLNIAIFVAFVVITMTIVIRASRTTKKASDFYTGGGQFSGPQNGFAIAGDYLSAASFLGIAGASRYTATTASCTPSASSSPGWWPCCWSRNCCATPADSRWPTC